MDMQRCINGHYYDRDKMNDCPYCPNTSQKIKTTHNKINLDSDNPNEVFIPSTPKNNTSNYQGLDLESTIPARGKFEKDTSVEPIVGWLVCTCGKSRGLDFKIRSGRNFIGSDKSMDICLDEFGIDKIKHAIISYNPREVSYKIYHGEKNMKIIINGNVISNTTELKPNDEIILEDIKLVFIPFCNDKFKW